MISSVFGKTKPVNYILVLAFLTVLFWVCRLWLYPGEARPQNPVEALVPMAALLLSVFLLNFIVQRNQLTATHSYVILLFALLVLTFPKVLLDPDGLLGHFFVLLGLRRLISLRSLKATRYKVFDATLWFLVASLFIPWALLYLLLCWVFVYVFEPRSLRTWLVPLAAMAVFGLLALAWALQWGDLDFFREHYQFRGIRWDGVWEQWDQHLRLGGFSFLVLAASGVAFLRLGKSGQGRIVVMRLTVLAFLLSMAVVLLETGQGAHVELLAFFPGATLMSKYLETLKKEKMLEAVLIGLTLAAAAVFATQWVLK
ncbi:DUF6427 family protein [Robiginitalea sp. M366]|uniref:DUF6427 family protein n=1 Tax=Robiginitalea aestuariiviva TaxID=3036903 RepID=UPI00240CED1E|nr:DUF6427 family protein [Robiginitalea aestuariiviva]MDG1571463.1 DUF6427 family protein [Robiginitalea aestuariiviva]